MALLKKKKKTKDVEPEEVVAETVVEELPVEEVDEDIQTTFNDDQEGLFEDVVFIKDEEDIEKEEAEREDN